MRIRSHGTAAVSAALAMLVLGVSCSATTGPSISPQAASGSTATPATSIPVGTGPSRGCNSSGAVTVGTTDERMTSAGVERSFQLIVPEGYDGITPLPVVLTLHSLTIDYRVVPTISGIPDKVDRYRFIAVSPSGRLNGRIPYWNAAPVVDNYDVQFVADLLDHLESRLCIDTSRIFSMGMSNGAQLSSLLGCRLADRITAIGPIAGVEFHEPCDGRPVPIMAFHGALDPIVKYSGGGLDASTIANQNFYLGALPSDARPAPGVDASMELWAKHNGCDPSFIEERVSPEVRKRSWPDCDATTILYIVDNGGHAWPGKPQPAFEAQFGHGTSDIDATTLLFEFFLG